MAKEDLVIKMKADNKELKAAFNEAKKEIKRLQGEIKGLEAEAKKSSRQFKENIKAIQDTVGKAVPGIGTFFKMFTAAGLAQGAIDGLKSIARNALNAGQDMDNFNIILQAAKDSFVTFADSILHFDWSIFGSGVFEANKELQAMLDTLGDIQLSYDLTNIKASAALSTFREAVSDPESTKEQKEESKANFEEKFAKLKAVADDQQKELKNALAKQSQTEKGYDFSADIMIGLLAKGYKLDKVFEEIKEWKRNVRLDVQQRNALGGKGKSHVDPALLIKPDYSDEEIEFASFWNKRNDEERKQTADFATTLYASIQYIKDMENQYNRTLKRMNKNENNVKIITPGSPDDFKKQIEKKQKELDNTADFEKRLKLKIDIKDLQRQLKVREENPELFRRLFTDRQPTPTPGVKPVDTSRVESDLGGKIRNIAPILPTIDINKLKDRMDETQEAIKKHEEEVRQLQNTYAGLGNILSDVASNFNSIAVATGSTDAVLQASMHTLMVFGAQLPTLINLMKLFSAETRQEAAAAMLAAVGITLKENSKLGPIIGTVIGLSSIAAVIAAYISSKNKFAYGGIVGGNSYTGDHILAGLNSGEMVINKRQQANLWKMLNSSYAERTSGAVAGDVRFRLKGTELIGVIENSRRKYAK